MTIFVIYDILGLFGKFDHFMTFYSPVINKRAAPNKRPA